MILLHKNFFLSQLRPQEGGEEEGEEKEAEVAAAAQNFIPPPCLPGLTDRAKGERERETHTSELAGLQQKERGGKQEKRKYTCVHRISHKMGCLIRREEKNFPSKLLHFKRPVRLVMDRGNRREEEEEEGAEPAWW